MSAVLQDTFTKLATAGRIKSGEATVTPDNKEVEITFPEPFEDGNYLVFCEFPFRTSHVVKNKLPHSFIIGVGSVPSSYQSTFSWIAIKA